MSVAAWLRRGLTAALLCSAFAHSASAQDPRAPQQAPPAVSQPPSGILDEPAPLARLSQFIERKTQPRADGPAEGFFVDTGNMITGSGWIAAGPGYRRRVFDGRALFTASGALSWKLYTEGQVSLDTPAAADSPVSAGARIRFEDSLQLNYFGRGNHSSFADRSGVRLRTADVSAYGVLRSGRRLTSAARIGWLGYTNAGPMGGRTPEYPDTDQIFTDVAAPGLSRQPAFVHADVSAILDARDEVADTSRGSFYRATVARYQDVSGGHYSFNAIELEAAGYVTAIPRKVVLAGHAWAALTGTSAGHEVPFYLMPNLGGKNTLRGFTDYRFTDRDMETFNLESRFRVYTHLDVAVFVDTGKVASRVGALRLNDLHSDAGFGLRFRTKRLTVARLDLAKSNEGWHLVFKMDEPFRRHAQAPGFVTVAPFVP